MDSTQRVSFIRSGQGASNVADTAVHSGFNRPLDSSFADDSIFLNPMAQTAKPKQSGSQMSRGFGTTKRSSTTTSFRSPRPTASHQFGQRSPRQQEGSAHWAALTEVVLPAAEAAVARRRLGAEWCRASGLFSHGRGHDARALFEYAHIASPVRSRSAPKASLVAHLVNMPAVPNPICHRLASHRTHLEAK